MLGPDFISGLFSCTQVVAQWGQDLVCTVFMHCLSLGPGTVSSPRGISRYSVELVKEEVAGGLHGFLLSLC